MTIIRIVLIPVFITVTIYGMYKYALYIFVCAALTDLFDGLLARITNQKTSLGQFLDPLADKILLVSSFILFAVYGWIPKWLTIVVISRDMIVVIGWFLIYMITHISKVEPIFTGKLAIALQLITLSYVLLSINQYSLPPLRDLLFLSTAAVTALSGLHYIYKGLKLTHAHP